ncbi:CDP-diacylglycerol--inositol 3-phosphatidyltransferase-like isoform X1 [Amphiura filiformis]|uniref:CDP-diacylglycerol--inositol 3-phosphatidyltransferase-like isoform X1 n=1 Tax=Amphiura filiformis TaxID=82378 RepID=UPI003B21F032
MAENIFLFVPNLIGYGRIILMIMAFWCMQTDYIQATFYYLLSGLLDAFDGHAARMLNQGTKFGAMLDQLTDRAGTLGLLIMLGTLYPSYVFWFQISACLDIVSHWLHLHSSATSGKSSHKSIDLSGNPVLHLYYTNRVSMSQRKNVANHSTALIANQVNPAISPLICQATLYYISTILTGNFCFSCVPVMNSFTPWSTFSTSLKDLLYISLGFSV